MAEKGLFTLPRRHVVTSAAIAGAALSPVGQALMRLGGRQGAVDAYRYLTEADNGPHNKIRLILGNHNMPEPWGDANKTVWDPYYNDGDLRVSLWRDEERTMVAQGMQEAFSAGKPYLLIADGEVPNMMSPSSQDAGIAFPMLPFPPGFSFPQNAAQRPEFMPDHFYVVATEPIGNFGMTADLVPNDPKTGALIEALGNVISSRYFPYSTAESNLEDAVKDSTADAERNLGIGEIVTMGAGIAARKLKINLIEGAAAGVVAIADVAAARFSQSGDRGELGWGIGNDTTVAEQRKDTVLANLTGENTHTPFSLWVSARTALGYEKAQSLLVHPTIYAGRPNPDNPPVPADRVDMLFGTYHNIDAPRIMEDGGFRKQVIQEFVTDLLTTANNAIDGNEQFRDLRTPKMKFYLLNDLIASLTGGTVKKVTIPWGKSKVQPNPGEKQSDAMIRFANSSAEITQYIYSSTLDQWVKEGLHAFLDANHIPYDPSFFENGQPQAPNAQAERSTSRRALVRSLFRRT